MDTDVLDLEIVTYFMLLCPYCEIALYENKFSRRRMYNGI